MWNQSITAAHAWLLFLDGLDGRTLHNACLPWLSTDEIERHNALPSARQCDYLAGLALCRWSLSRYAPVDPSEWRFARSSRGKPRVLAPVERTSLHFSLARTNGLAICLVTRAGAAGVDAEDLSRPVDVAEIGRHFLPPAELKRLERLPDGERTAAFFKLWVLHEAYVKGTGRGLAGTSERIRIRLDAEGNPLPIGNWRFFFCQPTARHVAAAAIRQTRDGASVQVTWLKSSLFQTRLNGED